MMKKTNAHWAVAAATLTVAGALIAPSAVAHTKVSKAESLAVAANNKIEALEAQLQAMQYELQTLRAEASRPQMVDNNSAKVQELDQWMAEMKSKPAAEADEKNNMVFFRGGYGHMDKDRGGTVDPTSVAGIGASGYGLLNGPVGNQDSFYFGAGFDFKLIDDLFGMMRGTDVFAELMFDYKELGNRATNGLAPSTVATLETLGFHIPPANSETATVNMLSLAASPKIKLFKGSAFRPWLIPIGFELSVISPPSDAITVLTPGVQFGLGADYKIWENLYIGADARYHYAPGNVDGVNTNGVTAGGYLGIGF